MEQQNQINLVNTIRKIKARPAMYVGNDRKIERLSLFLEGYRYATIVHHLEEDEPVTKNFMEFHAFTAKKLHKYPTGFGWSELINDECGGDSEKGLALFFELFEEFVEEQSQPPK